MESVLDGLNIQGSAREKGRNFADLTLHQQIMQLYGLQLSQQSQIDTQAAANFLRSEVFEMHVVARLRTALLAPWLTNYVTQFQEWILNDIQCSPGAWRVEPDVTNVAEQWQHFSSELKVKTTQIRAQNKITMYRMRAKGADINKIAAKLAPKGMVIREHHRARLAWLMLSTVEFDELCEQGTQKAANFWDWVGKQVLNIKSRIQEDAQYTTDLQRRTAMTQVFTRALSLHRNKFPPVSSAPPPKERPGWQETLEEAMKLGAVI
ncbi:hypothetical protein CTheo_8999 [Ceratobasidium theobromae]|uniref:Uncharacterized protein n=1 Tax=Ceratobasidium theobromae TaxID=1582974 RepID=A0A5N5Q6W5_9AGAM|nr:hypothetical protein CTheo_8999 [Ceratobasidium theobromae]